MGNCCGPRPKIKEIDDRDRINAILDYWFGADFDRNSERPSPEAI